MTAVQVRRVDGSTFLARGPTNHWVVMDAGKDEGGHEGGSSPMELVLMALGGCSGIDVELMLHKMHVAVRDLRIEITAERAEEHPRVYTSIQVAYHFWGRGLPRSKLERAVALSQETYCSVSNMLNKVADLTSEIVVHEAVSAE